MSNANNPIKVLRTALKRVEKGWTTGRWRSEKPNEDGNYSVCLEGAVYGYCSLTDMVLRGQKPTEAQKTAIKVLEEIIAEEHPSISLRTYYPGTIIPGFNDAVAESKDDVLRVIKLGIIRLESGWPFEEELDQADVDDFMESIKN